MICSREIRSVAMIAVNHVNVFRAHFTTEWWQSCVFIILHIPTYIQYLHFFIQFTHWHQTPPNWTLMLCAVGKDGGFPSVVVQ